MDAGIKIDVSRAVKKLLRAKGTLTPVVILKAIGLKHLEWVGRNFASRGAEVGRWKALSAFTIAHRKRGGDAPLQDTGIFRASFTPQGGKNIFRLTPSSVTIGSAMPFASYHEQGVGPIHPVRARALRIPGRGGYSFLKSTRGIPQRKILPTVSIGKRLALSLIEAKIRGIENG